MNNSPPPISPEGPRNLTTKVTPRGPSRADPARKPPPPPVQAVPSDQLQRIAGWRVYSTGTDDLPIFPCPQDLDSQILGQLEGLTPAPLAQARDLLELNWSRYRRGCHTYIQAVDHIVNGRLAEFRGSLHLLELGLLPRFSISQRTSNTRPNFSMR